MRNSQQEKFQVKLLPYKAKILGLILLCFAISTLFLKFYIKWEFMPKLMKFIILIALVIISLSKDKIEDEMKNFLRLKCFVFSLVASVIFYIIIEILNFMDMDMKITATHILSQIFLQYIMSYEIAKYKR